MKSTLYKNSPKITVLMSVFNGERWLEECIISILNQTYGDFEFIIIDDGSVDQTTSIIKKFLIIDHRIKFFRQENIGLTKTLNKGLKLAKGQWIARIDADDIATNTRLEDQYKLVKKNGYDLVGARAKLIDTLGNEISEIVCPLSGESIKKNLYRQGIIFPHSTAFFRLSTVIKIGGYRETLEKSQDYDLWLRMSIKSKIGCSEYLGGYIRNHKKRISYNDFGIEQRLLAHCALVSYYIRSKLGPLNDPLEPNRGDMVSRKFKEYVYNQIELSNLNLFYRKLYFYKLNVNNKIFKRIRIFRYLIIPIFFNTPNLIYILINWIKKGDYVSEGIAVKWMNTK